MAFDNVCWAIDGLGHAGPTSKQVGLVGACKPDGRTCPRGCYRPRRCVSRNANSKGPSTPTQLNVTFTRSCGMYRA